MSEKRDFYEVLGISKSATADEIKKAHRRLARKYHPDLNKNDPTAEKKFKEVQEAYDVLSDDKKRKAYDQFGHAGVNSAAAAEAAAAAAAAGQGRGRGAGGFRYTQQTPGGATVDFGDVDFGDIFEMFTGGRRGGGRGRQQTVTQEETPGADITYEANISFLESITGTKVLVRLTHPDGSRPEEISIKVPAGVKEGAKIRVGGHGQPSATGGPRGDLIITVKIGEHPYFRRDGQDILLDLPISLKEAIEGASISVPTVDGNVDLRIPPGMTSGKKLRVRGKGVPQKDGSRGDQYCRLMVQVPSNLTDEERKQLTAISEKHAEDPRKNLW